MNYYPIHFAQTTQPVKKQVGEAGSKGQPNPPKTWPLMIILLVLMYFILIHPQRKRQKAQQNMISSIKSGENIVTIGGIHGRVEQVKDTSVTIKIAEGIKIDIEKSAIARIIPKKIAGKSKK